MDHETAQQFVSILYDREEVPEEATRHIAGCPSCQAYLRDYAALSSEIRALAAVSERNLPPLQVPSSHLIFRRRWWNLLSRPVSVPRIAAAAFAALLILTSAGWLRAIASSRTITKFQLDTSSSSQPGGSRMRSSWHASTLLEIGRPNLSLSMHGNQTIASLVEVLKIRNGAVVLSVRLKRFESNLDSEQIGREIKKLKPKIIVLVPGQQLSVPVEGGGSILMGGSIVHEEEGRIISVKKESLLPAVNELSINGPVIIDDGTQIIAKALSAGTTIRCPEWSYDKCGIGIYSPGAGLFYFSTHPVPGSIAGLAGMSVARFTEDGHTYMLYSATPITGGNQPQTVWMLHVKNYLPSQNGNPKSDDGLDALYSGGVPGRR